MNNDAISQVLNQLQSGLGALAEAIQEQRDEQNSRTTNEVESRNACSFCQPTESRNLHEKTFAA